MLTYKHTVYSQNWVVASLDPAVMKAAAICYLVNKGPALNKTVDVHRENQMICARRKCFLQ